MSKKSKKQSRKTSGQRASIRRSESKVAVATTSADINRPQIAESGSKSRSLKSYEAEFNPDYSQTVKDLRRIGTLAGTFFIVLIILSFFLR
jgi:hypothetical protein